HFREELRRNYFVKLGKPLGLGPAHVTMIVVYGLPLLLCYALAARPFRFLWALAQTFGAWGRSPTRLHGARQVNDLPHREPLLSYLFVRRPLLFGLAVGTFMINGFIWQNVTRLGLERVLYQARNFYGVLKVTRAREVDGGLLQLRLTNGTT